MSDKIQPHHLQRKAILYIRQSSAYQVSHNLESQKLQYGMQTRLRQLGWQDIEVVDEDLGCSAAGNVQRGGFEHVVAEVGLGKVGVVAALELSRFARNSREWQQLMEVCRLVDTLLIDQETVYSARLGNDRLLLGLKGSLNEYELELLRQRSVEARREKARRGELLIGVPAGFLKTEDQQIQKDPDRRVREAVALVFSKFFERGSARQTLVWFQQEGLELPVRLDDGGTGWRRPNYRTVYRFLVNPVYAGAYAYGKTETITTFAEGQRHSGKRHKPPDEWLVLRPENHEGYISWQQYQQIQCMLADNCNRPGHMGAAKKGLGLLAGLLRCRRCGRKMGVHYTGTDHKVLRYHCQTGWVHNAERKCISFGGIAVDEALHGQILRVIQPAAVEAAVMAQEQASQAADEVLAALQRDLEAARYAAGRVGKQFQAADPENRLVADELERRWEVALQRVQELERRIEQHTAGRSQQVVPDRAAWEHLADDLEAVWKDSQCDASLKKRIVRTLIHDVIADVDVAAGEIVLVIHWQGGVHTELRVARRRRGHHGHETTKDIVAAVRLLAQVCPDKEIAGLLQRNGLRTGKGNRWTAARVTALRCRNQIPCYNATTRQHEGWMNLSEASAFLGVAPGTLRVAVVNGNLAGQHPLADGPWVFRRQDLETEAAVQLVRRVRSRSTNPAKASPEQGTPDLFGTYPDGAL
jgi:DNA invertase Pin-like site-specific DNA recombinase